MNESHLRTNHKMASNTTNELCPLCCFRSESCFKTNNEMNVKIEKYLQIKMEYRSGKICSNCYSSIETFHEFYERVHLAQKNFSYKYLTPAEHQLECQLVFKTETEDPTLSKKTEAESNSLPKRERSDAVSISEQKENNENVCAENDKNEASYFCKKSENKKHKLNHLKFKEISSEIEKKMIEFYNIKCEKCENGKFTSFKMLNKHYTTVHNTQGYIRCCKRNIRVNDKYYLRSHMFKHLQPDTCRCRICGKELSSLATLKHHMILHKPTEERPFQCSKCDKRFCCKNDLKNHEKAIHLPENEREDYICDVCGKVFQKVANLRYHHSTVHLQEKKYICEICAKSFTTQSGLRTHINAAHSTLSPIQCHECNKWLKTKDTFQKHLQLHQNNTYPCTHCSKVCNSSASLRSHLVKHSEDRPYSCTFCKKSFKTKTHLKNHSTQHVEGSSYKCPYCSKLFVNMSNYYTHRKRMHSAETARNAQDEKTGKDDTSQQLNLTQKNNYKIIKNDIENYSDSFVPDTVPLLRQNVVETPVSLKYL